MSFVFPLLLGSIAFIGVPVLIHLIMRQKPKTLRFPAFRFLIQKHRTNLRKLRLRHLLLLTMRILLIAAVVLALARPQVFHQGLGLRGDRPVAAVLVFDTSLSMDYKDSNGDSRLEEAKKRGLELIDQLPEGSRVAVLDTADPGQTAKEWYQALSEAKKRIAALQPKYVNASVSQRLETAWRYLADLGRDRDDERARQLPRIVFVFSDRTRASWDVARLGMMRDAADQVPPTLLGLQQARGDIANLVDMLADLRRTLPPTVGQDYPEQALVEGLTQLKDAVQRLTPEDLPPDVELTKALDKVRRPARELIDTLTATKEIAETAKEYRDKLLAGLHAIVRDLAGSQVYFVDVGVDQPANVAILDLALPTASDGHPQQVFEGHLPFVVRVIVQATGKDVQSALTFRVGKKTFDDKAIDLKAGQKETFSFAVNSQDLGLTPGPHSAEVHLKTKDQLLFDNSRYVTFAIRELRKVLVLADDAKKAEYFRGVLEGLGFAADVNAPRTFLDAEKRGAYHAIYLFALADPPATLWQWLEEYVRKGGNVGVIPGRDEMNAESYTKEPALNLLPGALTKIHEVPKDADGLVWNYEDSAMRDSALHRLWVLKQKEPTTQFFVAPARAAKFWGVTPKGKEMVIVRYDTKDAYPAVLERKFAGKMGRAGKVLLFTTPFDERQPRWTNYLESSFHFSIIGYTTDVLAGELGEARLNFILGQTEPVVSLPPMERRSAYVLSGPDMVINLAPPDAGDLIVRQATNPGNYVLSTPAADNNQVVARFSLNMPPEESDLTRVDTAQIEAVLGQDCILTATRQANIRDLMQDRWSEPMELFPPLMVLLLFVLVLENLLANKFYRKEPEPVEAT